MKDTGESADESRGTLFVVVLSEISTRWSWKINLVAFAERVELCSPSCY